MKQIKTLSPLILGLLLMMRSCSLEKRVHRKATILTGILTIAAGRKRQQLSPSKLKALLHSKRPNSLILTKLSQPF
jgi:hypothetical protein